MLKVQEFLRSGKTLEDLKKEFGVTSRVNPELGVVCLNYSMIDSPMGEQITQECRALILQMGSWDVVGIAFNKFFNHSEVHAPSDFNWGFFKTYEKLDGSLIVMWYHHSKGWQIASRSVPDGSSTVDDSGLTFRDLVLLTLKDMGVSWESLQSNMDTGYSYIYELLTPENQIVVKHKERSLVLTGIRSIKPPFFKESDIYTWFSYNSSFPIPLVHRYDGFSKEAVMSSAQERDPSEHEGYVLVCDSPRDYQFLRVKVKSNAYCLASNQRDGLGKSNRTRLELILSGKEDDVLPLLSPSIQTKILVLKSGLTGFLDEVGRYYTSISHIESQKDFASLACKTKYSGVLFALRSGKAGNLLDWIKQINPKTVLEWINVVDENEERK